MTDRMAAVAKASKVLQRDRGDGRVTFEVIEPVCVRARVQCREAGNAGKASAPVSR
jgi:hypothetical protein